MNKGVNRTQSNKAPVEFVRLETVDENEIKHVLNLNELMSHTWGKSHYVSFFMIQKSADGFQMHLIKR